MSKPLQTITEDLPLTYDRKVDYMCWNGREPNDNEQFFKALPKVIDKGKKKQGKKMKFFKKLGVPLRRKIYSYVYEINPTYKEVNLSMDFAVKAVFPPGHFIVPWDLIQQVAGALLSGRQMRDELLTYFWSTYHFHVTFSAFTAGPTFSGLSHKWLNLYAERVNHLTVEVDFTTLSFSACKDAKLLSNATGKVEKQINNLIDGLSRRFNKNVMATLTLKLRRYSGFRPYGEDAREEDKTIPYCPDDAQYIFDDFHDLKWMLLQLRMAGFSIPYIRRLSNSIFENRVTRPRAVIIPAWPTAKTAPAEVKYLSSIALKPNASSGARSTGEGSGLGAGFSGNVTPRVGLAASSSVINLSAAVEEGQATKTASSPSSSASNGSTSLRRRGAVRRRTGSVPSPSSEAPKSPKSPNAMNHLNAQDPAFTRAFDAMRLDPEEGEDNKEADKEKGSPVAKKNKQKSKKGKNKGKKH